MIHEESSEPVGENLMVRRIMVALLLIPALILATGLACGLPSGEEQELPVLRDLDLDRIRETVEQGRYVLTMVRQLTAMNQSQDNLESLLLAPELGNVRWTGSVRAQVAVVRLVCTQLEGIDPPQDLESVHTTILEVCGDCRRTVDIALDGIDSLDPGAIAQAADSAQRCVEGLQANKAVVEELREQIDTRLEDLDLGGINREDLNLEGVPGLSELELPSLGDEASPPTSLDPPTVNTGSNLRAGPGTNFERVGGLTGGTVLAVVGRNEAGDWLAIEVEGMGQAWIAAFLVDNAPKAETLPVIASP